jgi:hypothetical protein
MKKKSVMRLLLTLNWANKFEKTSQFADKRSRTVEKRKEKKEKTRPVYSYR